MTQDGNTHFVELLQKSSLALDEKKQIVAKIKSGEMTENQIMDLYEYLVEEEKVRKGKLPYLQKMIKDTEETMIENKVQKYIKNKSKNN